MSKYDRALPGDSIRLAALIGLLVMIVMMSGWEMYWRSDGSIPSYRNSEGLWAIQRRRVNEIEGDKTVLAGSSRMYFNAQLDVWERESGERPIQLSLEGTSPISLMEDLAEEPDMTGTLIVGVAGEMFFTGFEYRGSAFERFATETPSQWLGQQISMLVEPYLAFYHHDYSLFTVLKRQAFPRREGVFFEMDVRRLAIYGKDRNARMYSKVETDPEYAELAKEIWAQFHRPIEELSEEERAEGLENHNKQIDRAVAATRKLQERGVEVIFVRHPFEGVYDIIEPMYFPRVGGWDVLIERTGALGVHWQDHPEMQGYWLPESSHLAAEDADRFTQALYRLIQRERAKRDSGEQE
jgi:hypothetical protein